MTYEVFLSYARLDGTTLARQLAQDLRRAEIRVFWDQDSIPAGVNWEKTLDDALEEATHIIVILTPQSVVSEEVMAEWRPMLNKGKNIIPVLYSDCEIPRRLSMRQYIDFRKVEGYQIALIQLIEALRDTATNAVQIKLTTQELLERAQAYVDSGQLELARDDYAHILRHESDPLLRIQTARILGNIKPPQALTLIVDVLNVETIAAVQIMLLKSLLRIVGRGGWRDEMPDLLEKMQPFLTHQDPEIRQQTIRVLAYGNVEEGVAAIKQLLRHDEVLAVRKQAALSLGRLRTADSTRSLVHSLNDPDVKVRVAVVQALGVHSDPRTLPLLKKLARGDKSRDVRIAARSAVKQITNS